MGGNICGFGWVFFKGLIFTGGIVFFSSYHLSSSLCLYKTSSQGKVFSSLNSAGVPPASQLPGGERRVFICTHISRQSSRTFYRSRSSTSGTCSGIAPPLCPCRGCSLCRSTSSRSCRSRWRSYCIAWKKEKAVSKHRSPQGFPNHRPEVVLEPASSARHRVKPARLHLSCSMHTAGLQG